MAKEGPGPYPDPRPPERWAAYVGVCSRDGEEMTFGLGEMERYPRCWLCGYTLMDDEVEVLEPVVED